MEKVITVCLERRELDHLYKSYGFEVNSDSRDLGIYLYKKGRYFGVDIVPLQKNNELLIAAEKEKEKYSDLGYAASVKCYASVTDAQAELFKSFFSYETTVQRLIKKYSTFQFKQTRNLLGIDYQYIDVPFESYESDEQSGGKLTEAVLSLVQDSTPRLIIIEAAAGYGKTCTAYELLYLIAKQHKSLRVPIFTELSRNRGASIFRYVLLDEIDIEYPTLNSELVLNEVKSGRIPLIIDGFDELLDKVNKSESNSSFEEVESMLETIGGLLVGQAKVILTTRRTAIFGGVEFERWMDKWRQKFEISRFTIKDPKIKDWLGEDKYILVKEKNVPIQHIANPVILSFLKSLTVVDFQAQISNTESLIHEYFQRILERERERHNLIITAERQYEIFKNVVRLLLELDITSESKDFFKEIIKDQNSKLLEYTRTLYSGIEKPSLEKLVDTLATHALLDKKGRNEDQIGFINDFILGNYIGEILIDSPIEKIDKLYSSYMIELGATAYKVQSTKNKFDLWNKINGVKNKFTEGSLFNFDLSLLGTLTKDYDSLSINDKDFVDMDFDSHLITNTAFVNCNFKNCSFASSMFNGISFIGCEFNHCRVSHRGFLDAANDVVAINCKETDCHILQFNKNTYTQSGKNFNSCELKVFHEIVGKDSAKGIHLAKFLSHFPKNELKQVIQAIHGLVSRGYLHITPSSYLSYNMNKLPEIKTLISVN